MISRFPSRAARLEATCLSEADDSWIQWLAMTDTLLSVTPEALTKIIEIRDNEAGDEPFALFLEIVGLNGPQFKYELSFMPVADAQTSDLSESHGDLTVIVPERDVENLTGAQISMGSDPANPALSIDNPNSPSPPMPEGIAPGELEGPLADKIQVVLERHVNPSIAAHGGAARLVSVEGSTAYLQLMGGCQGCGMASVTLQQGIERILKDSIPELVEVVDVTDHASGDNPFYESAKK